MNKLILTAILFLGIHTLQAQERPISPLEAFVGSSWVSEGLQLGGFEGKTVYEFEWGLNRQIIHVKTYTTDPQTRKFGLRNEGVRAFNSETENLEFYEFDKLGGITKGKIAIEGRNIHYEYEYQGLQLRDSWIHVSDDEYNFIAGTWDGTSWSKKFHETTIVRAATD